MQLPGLHAMGRRRRGGSARCRMRARRPASFLRRLATRNGRTAGQPLCRRRYFLALVLSRRWIARLSSHVVYRYLTGVMHGPWIDPVHRGSTR